MDKDARRAARTAYRERKVVWVIASLQIGAQVWVTMTPDAAALERRLGFSLRTGGDGAPGMRAAFAEAKGLKVEVLERLDETLSAMARDTLGKKRLAHWAEVLGGAALGGGAPGVVVF